MLGIKSSFSQFWYKKFPCHISYISPSKYLIKILTLCEALEKKTEDNSEYNAAHETADDEDEEQSSAEE